MTSQLNKREKDIFRLLQSNCHIASRNYNVQMKRFINHVNKEGVPIFNIDDIYERIRLAAQLGSNLSGVLYVLDEPTIGLHSRDNERLLSALEQLRERGMDQFSIEEIVCFSACNVGPNVVIPSKRCWLSGVTKDKVEVVIDYLNGGADVTELQKSNDPVLDQMIFEMIDAGLLEKANPT